jgi:hypothetical protein
MFKSHFKKSNHIVQGKKEVDANGASVFSPDYSATVFRLVSTLEMAVCMKHTCVAVQQNCLT